MSSNGGLSGLAQRQPLASVSKSFYMYLYMHNRYTVDLCKRQTVTSEAVGLNKLMALFVFAASKMLFVIATNATSCWSK